ncbi:FixH family protein [Negadavirga shengliensis]|uniref:FixH family protein n=1 Tax=Negadavirga shengliensis TaxID=1389218 RepID=A0ABV9T4K7_9BACT
MDWGKGIVIVFAVFATIMVTMVTICMKQDDLHLVTANYYEEEIKYQQHIDKVSNTVHLDRETLVFDRDGKVLHLDLPVGALGELHLFRPSDASLDRKVEVKIDGSSSNSLDLKGLKPGYWRVKLSWTAGDKEYFEEKKIEL